MFVFGCIILYSKYMARANAMMTCKTAISG
jgi:hypothetical protein